MTEQRIGPIHPGIMLLHDFLRPKGISMLRLSRETGMAYNSVWRMANGIRSITSRTAHKLGEFFNMSPDFWINAQAEYDLQKRNKQEMIINIKPSPRSCWPNHPGLLADLLEHSYQDRLVDLAAREGLYGLHVDARNRVYIKDHAGMDAVLTIAKRIDLKIRIIRDDQILVIGLKDERTQHGCA